MIRIAFFGNNASLGKTSLVYHLAHMLVDLGHEVLLLDLDPQSNLTAMCFDEDRLLTLWWPDEDVHSQTILGSLRPLIHGLGDIKTPHIETLRDGLSIIPGDLGLSTFEDQLADAWPHALAGNEDAFRILSAFHRLAGDDAHSKKVVLIDVGPSLGALNRAALLAADYVVTPLAPDLYSIQGLRYLGPTLNAWRKNWQDRQERSPDPELLLPSGAMQPLGYVVMQVGMRLCQPLKTYLTWVDLIPDEYVQAMFKGAAPPPSGLGDPTAPWQLGLMRDYQVLMPLAYDARKPMFHLKPGDGAIGANMGAVLRCREEFALLARRILAEITTASHASESR